MASAHVSPDKPDNCARVLRTAIIKLFFLFTASPPPPKLSYIALYDILGAFGRRSLNLEPADLSRKELICEESELYSALQWRLRLSLLSTSHTHKLLCVYVCVCMWFRVEKIFTVFVRDTNNISFSAVRVIFIQKVSAHVKIELQVQHFLPCIYIFKCKYASIQGE